MKNKAILAVLLILVLALLSSCAMIPVSRLDAMFRTDGDSVVTGGGSAAPAKTESNDGDMVTIRRDEYEKLKKFSDALTLYEFANTNFYEETDPDRLIEYASRGVLAGLDDPYSFYYDPEEFKDMWEEDEGSYVGIGVMITSNMNTQICTISRVFKGGPAEEVGVQRGDILYRVGEDLMVNASNVDDAVDIMRGEPNTDVDVTFLRDGEEITFTITRREVIVNQIESTMLGDGIGYIALYEFAGECEKEFESELKRLVSEGAEGIILDLRDNPGGWVDQARYIADLFMDEGEICYLVYRDGVKRYDEYRTKDGKTNVKLGFPGHRGGKELSVQGPAAPDGRGAGHGAAGGAEHAENGKAPGPGPHRFPRGAAAVSVNKTRVLCRISKCRFRKAITECTNLPM